MWVNLGPLLWHGSPGHQCLQLTAEELSAAARRLGLYFEEEAQLPGLSYCADVGSMTRTLFDVMFFVARKGCHPR